MSHPHMKGVFQHQSSVADMSFIVKEYHQQYFTSPFHFHDAYELIMIAKSYGKLYAGNKILNFSDGEIFMFGPGLPHCFLNEKSFRETGDVAHAIVIFFKEDFLGDGFFRNTELTGIRELLQKSLSGIKVAHVDTALQNEFKKIAQAKGMDALLLLLHMLHRLARNRDKLQYIHSTILKIQPKQEDADRLEVIIRYIIDNFKEDLDSREAAALACLNEAAFCRYFKRRTEKTFSQFVNYVRVTHATNLLTEENWSIANICFECGYKNISYFNRQFKEIIGCTPLEYRQQHLRSGNDLIMEAS